VNFQQHAARPLRSRPEKILTMIIIASRGVEQRSDLLFLGLRRFDTNSDKVANIAAAVNIFSPRCLTACRPHTHTLWLIKGRLVKEVIK
jgi:hypothetical protein